MTVGIAGRDLDGPGDGGVPAREHDPVLRREPCEANQPATVGEGVRLIRVPLQDLVVELNSLRHLPFAAEDRSPVQRLALLLGRRQGHGSSRRFTREADTRERRRQQRRRRDETGRRGNPDPEPRSPASEPPA